MAATFLLVTSIFAAALMVIAAERSISASPPSSRREEHRRVEPDYRYYENCDYDYDPYENQAPSLQWLIFVLAAFFFMWLMYS
ncbi:MAG: hypothetical protein J5I98_25235 [Phaeodactylibacter sp.]|nr:hypothetical protein [Phaeodactylibacter sp.]